MDRRERRAPRHGLGRRGRGAPRPAVANGGGGQSHDGPMTSDPTRVTRLREKERPDRSQLDALLDSAVVGHFAIADPDRGPVVIPTAVVRDADRVLAHGSPRPRGAATAGGG